jgi:hypothetical protein
MAEVIDEGVTGGIVGSIDEAVSALPAILSLNRRGVHDRAVARFGVERMVDEYLHAYETVLGR